MEILSGLAQGFAVALQPMNLLWCLLGVILGTLVGIFFGMYPAMSAAKLDPIEALRREADASWGSPDAQATAR